MKASYATAATFSFIGLICTTLHAQNTKPKYEVGLRLSSLIYQGDLSPSAIGSWKSPRLVIGVFGTRILNSKFSVRANLDYGKIKGDDQLYSKPEWRQQRALNFYSSVLDLSAHVVYNFKNNYKNDYRFAPYIFGGLGFSFLNIKRDYSQFNYEFYSTEAWVGEGLVADINTTPPKAIFNLPVGAGLRFPLTEKLSLITEATYRFMFTDYLDGFSKVSNTTQNDHFYNVSVGVVYRFGNNAINCPKY